MYIAAAGEALRVIYFFVDGSHIIFIFSVMPSMEVHIV